MNKKIKIMIEAVVVLFTLVCAGLAYLFLNEEHTYTVDENATYIYNDAHYSIPAGSRGTLNEDNELLINISGSTEPTTLKTPIYLDSSDTIILPKQYLFLTHNYDGDFSISSLDTLTSVTYDADNYSFTFKKDRKSANETKGFLFDGEDTYVFLEQVTMTVDGDSKILSPLSYVVAKKDNWIKAYDYLSDTYFSLDTDSEVVVTDMKESYSVELMNDVYEYFNRQYIITSFPGNYDNYFEVN